MSSVEHVSFATSDGITIVADYYPSSGKRFALLLHMMPATKESWRPFAEKLVVAGYAVLAIDERGHGESTMGGTLNYKTFSEKDQQDKILDVQAAMGFLKEKGATESGTVLVGASIGANLSMQYLAQHPDVAKAVALSPGLNYRGVMTEPSVVSLQAPQKLLMIASQDDDRQSYGDVVTLHEKYPQTTEVILESNVGHGTTMFEKKPELMDLVVDWLGT